MSTLPELNPDYMPGLLGNNKQRSKFETLKVGAAVYRILPSFHPVKKEISNLWNSHFLQMANGKGSSVLCTLYTAERHCPICDRAKEVEELIKRAKESDDKAKLQELNDLKRNLSRNSKVYYNAINVGTGELVILQLSKTASKELEGRIIEAVQEKKFDPLSVSAGVAFKFVRTGTGLDTKVTVDFMKTSTVDGDGDIVEKLTKTAIAPEVLNGLQDKVTDIFSASACFLKTLTAKELAAYLRGEAVEAPRSESQSSRSNTLSAAVAEQQAATSTPAAQEAAPQAAAKSEDPMAGEIARLRALRQAHNA